MNPAGRAIVFTNTPKPNEIAPYTEKPDVFGKRGENSKRR
jgi:hypothetical protein